MPRKRTARRRRVASKRRSVRVGGSRRKSRARRVSRRRVLRGGTQRSVLSVASNERPTGRAGMRYSDAQIELRDSNSNFELLQTSIQMVCDDSSKLTSEKMSKITDVCVEWNTSGYGFKVCPYYGHEADETTPENIKNLIHLDCCKGREGGDCVRKFDEDTLKKIRDELRTAAAEAEMSKAFAEAKAETDKAYRLRKAAREAEANAKAEADTLSLIPDETLQPSGSTETSGERSSPDDRYVRPSPPGAADKPS